MRSEFAPIFKLGRAERLQLVEDLWDSIAEEEGQLPVPEWQREELRRRKERFQRHPSSGRTWGRSSDGRAPSMIERVIYAPEPEADVAEAYIGTRAGSRGWARSSCGV
jgi:putative addiction module component (TIGR02574 family)